MPAAARSFRDIIRSSTFSHSRFLLFSVLSATTCLIREPSNKRREMFSINPVLRMTVVLYRRMWRSDSLVAFAHLYSASRRANSSCDRAALRPPCCYSFRRIRIPSDGGTERLNFSTGTVYYIHPLPLLILLRNSKIHEMLDGRVTRYRLPTALSA